jgi:hypothetical protein
MFYRSSFMANMTRQQYDLKLKKEPGKLPGSERIMSVSDRRRKDLLDAQRRHNQARGLRRGPHKPRFGSRDEAREMLIGSILQEVMDDTYKPDMRGGKQKKADDWKFKLRKHMLIHSSDKKTQHLKKYYKDKRSSTMSRIYGEGKINKTLPSGKSTYKKGS